jgi:hypothetical protein
MLGCGVAGGSSILSAKRSLWADMRVSWGVMGGFRPLHDIGDLKFDYIRHITNIQATTYFL